jgi:signal transduction histidine kinase
MFLIQKHLKNINFKKIEKIPLNLDKTDEIYEIINSINKFLELIEKNTKNLHEFNSIVSHEFKTPLMIMSSQIEFAYKTQKYDESLIKIEKQIDLLNNLLETFLFISKLQNSRIKLKLNKLDISQITENLASEYAQIYSHKNINLSLNISK